MSLRPRLSWAVALAALLPACSLSNIAFDECSDDRVCVDTFGLGSQCDAGFCTAPVDCDTGFECQSTFGGGACVEGRCQATLPVDDRGLCSRVEPVDLASRPLVGPGAPVVVGGMFRFGESTDDRIAQAVQLAAAEINDSGGLGAGRPLGVVFCDVGAPGGLDAEVRRERIGASVDHLSTLGVPLVIGPTTSSDSLVAVGQVLARDAPILFLSPAATSPALTSEPDRLDPSDAYGLFWRTAPSDVIQGTRLATDVVGKVPADDPSVQRVALLYVADAYGQGLADVFEGAWAGETLRFPFDAGDDWGAIAGDVSAAAPDAVVLVTVDAADTVAFLQEQVQRPELEDRILYVTDGSKDTDRLLDGSLSVEVQEAVFFRLFGTGPATVVEGPYVPFAASYADRFGDDPSGFAWTGNAYDATYAAAAAVVFAADGRVGFDGRNVGAGLARLVEGTPIEVGPTRWSALKTSLTAGERVADLVGVSGGLDFDPATGDTVAPLEVWQPTVDPMRCAGGAPPCFETLTVLP